MDRREAILGIASVAVGAMPGRSDAGMTIKDEHSEIISDLKQVIEKHSLQMSTDTPSFILARFCFMSIQAFYGATGLRDRWMAHHRG